MIREKERVERTETLEQRIIRLQRELQEAEKEYLAEAEWFQVAFASEELPGAVWLSPPGGAPKPQAEQLLRAMVKRKPHYRHWLEPLRKPGERMRIRLPDGTMLSVTGVTYSRTFVQWVRTQIGN